MTDNYYPVEAINTIEASPWTLFLAKLFGKKTTVHSFARTIKLSAWRGKTYMIDASHD